MFNKPPSLWGEEGMGVNFKKHHFAKNCITYPAMQRKSCLSTPTPHVGGGVSVYKYNLFARN